MLWHAKVDCYEQHHGEKAKLVKRAFLLEADNSDNAWKAASDAGAKAATFGPKLVMVEVREVGTVSLPYELAPTDV